MENTSQEKSKKYMYVLPLNDQLLEHLDIVMEETGATSKASAIRACIMAYSRDLRPAYISNKLKAPSRQKYDTPEDRLKAKIEKDKQEQLARTAVEYDHASGLCKLLNGKIIDNNNGTFGCEYIMYEKIGKRVLEGKRTVPFDLLTREHVEAQFKGGTKEEVFAILHPEPLLSNK